MKSDLPARADGLYLGFGLAGGDTIGPKRTYDGPLHSILFGPNGVGKAMRVLAPNLLQNSGKSIVVIDPKGQLAAMTARWRFENGNDVKIIDPFGVLASIVKARPRDYQKLVRYGLVESAGFNPLGALDPDSDAYYDDAAVITEALIKIQGNDPHWPESAQGLVTGLIMWECLRCRRAGEIPSLANVRKMLTEADAFGIRPVKDAAGNILKNKDGGDKTVKIRTQGLQATAREMVASGVYELESLAGRFASDEMSDEIESVRSTADTQTRWLLSRPMRKDLDKDGVRLKDLKTGAKPLTVYVILPAHFLETHSVWLRLVVSEALRTSMTAGGRGVLLILDEFAALGHLPIVERLFGVTRDYKVQIWPVFQDLPQLKGLYRERWETLLGMAGVIQSFRAGDLTTAEWLSKRAGNHKVTQEHTGRSANMGQGYSLGSSTGYSQVQEPIIPYEQMFGQEERFTLNFFAGRQEHVRLDVPFLWQIGNLQGRADPNPYYGGPT